MTIESRVEAALAAAASVFEPLPSKQVWAWQTAWRQKFCRGLFEQTGHWTRGPFEWHVFSFGHHPCRSGAAALRAYRGLPPCEYLLLSAWSRRSFGYLCQGPLPALDLQLDLIVAPLTTAWTMAFTHEAAHGPFFAVEGAADPEDD